MQLIIAMIQDRDADAVIAALTANNQRVTRIGTTGGFLQQGFSTLLIGVVDDAVEKMLAEVKAHSQRRTMFMPLAVGNGDPAYALSEHVEVEIGGATAFILRVEHFEQF